MSNKRGGGGVLINRGIEELETLVFLANLISRRADIVKNNSFATV